MHKEELLRLAEKIAQGTANDEEMAQYNQWYNHFHHSQQAWDEKLLGDRQEKAHVLFEQIHQQLHDRRKTRGRSSIIKIVAAAACFTLVTATVYVLLHNRSAERPISATALAEASRSTPIKPGGNKAVLTLSDGKRITLDDASNGQLADEQGLSIKKTTEGQLVYEVKKVEPEGPLAFNTIETPRGGQYQVVLPDGSKVWLNAASSLTYSTTFSKKERKVILKGEAYFEVAPATKHPFVVQTDHQQINVLGTRFNVNAYEDEGLVQTTLLDGAVKVRVSNHEHVLKPGQQSILRQTDQAFFIQAADLEKVMAWKNGYFIFNKENLHSVMRQVARWYDVDVRFNGSEKQEDIFVGRLPRSADITDILKVLKLSKVRYKMEGRTLMLL